MRRLWRNVKARRHQRRPLLQVESLEARQLLATGVIEGHKWHDLDGNGLRDPSEPGLPGWQVYVDVNRNSAFDSGEPVDTTDRDGRYTLPNIPIGLHRVASIPQASEYTRTFPVAAEWQLVRVNQNEPSIDVDFGAIDVPEPFTVGNFVVGKPSSRDNIDVLLEIDLGGNIVQSIVVHDGSAGMHYQIHDIVVDADGRSHMAVDVNNVPKLVSFDPQTNSFSEHTGDGQWESAPNVPIKLAIFGDYVFATDLENASADGGLLRFDTTNGSVVRYSDSIVGQPRDVNVGLNGLLYVLDQDGQTVNYFDPTTMAAVGSIVLPSSEYVALAADHSGHLFAKDGLSIDHLDPTGGLLESAGTKADPHSGDVNLSLTGALLTTSTFTATSLDPTFQLQVAFGLPYNLNGAGFSGWVQPPVNLSPPLLPVTDGGDVAGALYHDLNADGNRDAGEPGIPGWTVFADTIANGTFDPGLEPAALTTADGTYVLDGVPPGHQTIIQQVEPGWSTPTVSQSVNVTGTTVTGVDFSAKRNNMPLTPGSVVIIKSANEDSILTEEEMLIEITPDARILQSWIIPGSAEFAGTEPEDLVFDSHGNLQILQRIANADPRITTFHSQTFTFTDHLISGWDAGEQLEAFEDYLFTSDRATGPNADGLLRIRVDTFAVERFAAGLGDPIDVTVGRDGIVYMLTDSVIPNYTTLHAFDPNSLAHIRSLELQGNYIRAVVDEDGHIFADGNPVTHFMPNGAVVRSSIAAGDVGPGDMNLTSIGLITFSDPFSVQSFDTRLHVAAKSDLEQPIPGFKGIAAWDDIIETAAPLPAVHSSVSGRAWHDLNGDGLRDAGEPVVAAAYVYADINDNGLLDTHEPYDITDSDGFYLLANVPVGYVAVRQIEKPGWSQTWPFHEESHTVRVNPNELAIEVNFGSKRDRVPFTSGNFITTNVDKNDVDMLLEYTVQGEIVQSIPVPGSAGTGVTINDVVMDRHGNARFITRTGNDARLTTYDPVFETFTDTPIPDWNLTGPGYLAVFDDFVFANDHLGGGSQSGILRIDLSDMSFTRFGSGEPRSVSVGQNGLLYSVAGSTISLYDPVTLGLVSTVSLPISPAAVAANEAGHVFAISTGLGGLYHFDPAGVQVDSLGSTTVPFPDDIAQSADGRLLTVSDFSSKIKLTEPNFDSSTSLDTIDHPAGGAFGAFVNPVAQTVLQPVTSGQIRGTVWHNLDQDTVKDSWEPGLAGWRVYVDENHSGGVDPGEPQAMTTDLGNYLIDSVPAGNHLVRLDVPPGWLASHPIPATQNVTTTAGGTVTGVHFGALAQARPFTADNVLVIKQGDAGSNDLLLELTRRGQVIQAVSIPGTAGSAGVQPRDMVVDDAGRVRIIGADGSNDAHIITYDSAVGSFSDEELAGWVVGGSAGALDHYLFADDNAGAGRILRIDVNDLSSTSFANGSQPRSVTTGLDGLVYALGDSRFADHTEVRVYDPVSLNHLRTFEIDVNTNEILVDQRGHVYAHFLGAQHYDANGAKLASRSISVHPGGYSMSHDGTVVVANAFKVEMRDPPFDNSVVLDFGGGINGFQAATFVQTPVKLAPHVVATHVFYDNSYFDLGTSGPHPADDFAIDASKQPLRPGQTATFANYVGNTSGLTGLRIDMRVAAPESVSLADFSFLAGNNADPSTWSAIPTPSGFDVRIGEGVGGSDAFVITFAAGAIQDQWLQVTITDSVLPEEFEFYYGNARADTGDSPGHAFTNTVDFAGPRDHFRPLTDLAPVTDRFDLNKDGEVGAADMSAARDLTNDFVTALKLIHLPPVAPPPAAKLVQLPPNPWQNPNDPTDVSADGDFSPLDVLLVINYLNEQGSGPLPEPTGDFAPPPYLDVDGDGHVTPRDVIVLINCLNDVACHPPTASSFNAEGEADVVDLIVGDVARQWREKVT